MNLLDFSKFAQFYSSQYTELLILFYACSVLLQKDAAFKLIVSQIYRVTDEALIAETMVWPIFFLMNVFFALKGSKLFIIIHSIVTTCYFT